MMSRPRGPQQSRALPSTRWKLLQRPFSKSQSLLLEKNRQFSSQSVQCPTAPILKHNFYKLSCGQKIVKCPYCNANYAFPEDARTFCEHVSTNHVTLVIVYRDVDELQQQQVLPSSLVDLRTGFKRERIDICSLLVRELCYTALRNTDFGKFRVKLGAFVLRHVHGREDNHLFCPFCCHRFQWSTDKLHVVKAEAKLHIFREHVARFVQENKTLCRA